MIRYFKLRKAIKQVIADHEDLIKALAESERNEPYTNLTWEEDGVWKGWNFNQNTNRYYFDDIGSESITSVWDHIFKESNE